MAVRGFLCAVHGRRLPAWANSVYVGVLSAADRGQFPMRKGNVYAVGRTYANFVHRAARGQVRGGREEEFPLSVDSLLTREIPDESGRKENPRK